MQALATQPISGMCTKLIDIGVCQRVLVLLFSPTAQSGSRIASSGKGGVTWGLSNKWRFRAILTQMKPVLARQL